MAWNWKWPARRTTSARLNAARMPNNAITALARMGTACHWNRPCEKRAESGGAITDVCRPDRAGANRSHPRQNPHDVRDLADWPPLARASEQRVDERRDPGGFAYQQQDRDEQEHGDEWDQPPQLALPQEVEQLANGGGTASDVLRGSHQVWLPSLKTMVSPSTRASMPHR